MRCPYCGKDNPPEARFCRACGKALTAPAPFSDDDPVPGADRKKRRGGRIALIVLAALVLVSGIVFRQAVAEFFARTFQSPEEYYRHVEARAINRFASLVGDRYAAAFGADGTGAAHETTLRIEPVIPGMDWLEQITLTGQTQREGSVSDTETALEVNGVELLTAEIYADAETTALRIPLLSDTALALSSDADLQAFSAAVGNAGLTRSEVEDLTRAVLTAAADQLHQVERSREPLTAEGISQRCAKLTVTIGEADADAIRKAVSDVLKRSDTAQKLLKNDAEAEALAERMTKPLLDAVAPGASAEMVLWVGMGGAVRGRAVTLPDGGSFRYALPISLLERAAGLQLDAAQPDGDAVSVRGVLQRETGSVSAAAVFDGTASELFTLRYSDLVLKQDRRSAAFELETDRDLGALVSVPVVGKYLGRLTLSGSFQQEGDSLESDLTLGYHDAALAEAHLERSAAAPTGVTAPDTVKERAEWLRSARILPALNELTRALREAGMPQDILRTVLKLLTEQLIGDSAA